MKTVTKVFFFVIAVGWSVNSNAALISTDLIVSGTNWSLFSGTGGGPLVDPVVIDFAISFDDSGDITNASSGLVINSFNLAISDLKYSYRAGDDLLALTDGSASPGGCGGYMFCTFIANISTASPTALFMGGVDTTGFYTANDISVAQSQVPVPVPATLALLGLGFAGISFQRRRKIKAA